jgi:hypothetical protein
LTDRRRDVDRAAHRLGEPARQRQADAGALDAGLLRSEPLEQREQLVAMLGADPRPGVVDRDAEPGRRGWLA